MNRFRHCPDSSFHETEAASRIFSYLFPFRTFCLPSLFFFGVSQTHNLKEESMSTGTLIAGPLPGSGGGNWNKSLSQRQP